MIHRHYRYTYIYIHIYFLFWSDSNLKRGHHAFPPCSVQASSNLVFDTAMERLGCSCPKRQGQRACAGNVPPARVYIHVYNEGMYVRQHVVFYYVFSLYYMFIDVWFVYLLYTVVCLCVMYVLCIYDDCIMYVVCMYCVCIVCLSLYLYLSLSLFFPNAKRCWHLILRCIEIKMDYCRLGTNEMTWGFWFCVSYRLDNSVWTTVATDACFGSSSWTLLHFIIPVPDSQARGFAVQLRLPFLMAWKKALAPNLSSEHLWTMKQTHLTHSNARKSGVLVALPSRLGSLWDHAWLWGLGPQPKVWTWHDHMTGLAD